MLHSVDSWKVFLSIVAILVTFICFGILGYDWDRQDEHKSQKETSDNSYMLGGGGSDTTTPQIMEKALSPSCKFSNPWRMRCWEEMKIHHPFVNLFSRYIQVFPRPLRAMLLMTQIIFVFTIIAVIYTNNSLCDHIGTRIECESQWLTAWIHTTSVCYWAESSDVSSGDHCNRLSIGGDFQLALKIALLAAVFSILPLLCLNWLFINVLAADTKSVDRRVAVMNSDAAGEGDRSDVEVSARSALFRRGSKKHLLDILEKQSRELFGCSVVTEVEQFQKAFHAFIRTKNLAEFKKLNEEWKLTPRRVLPVKRRVEVSKARHQAVKLVRKFKEDKYSPSRIGDSIMILFLKELTSGYTHRLVDMKFRREHMTRKKLHYLLKLIGFIFCVGLCVGTLVYLYIFTQKQDRDRQHAWFYSAMLWLGLHILVLSSLNVVLQHICLSRWARRDLQSIIEKVNEGRMNQNAICQAYSDVENNKSHDSISKSGLATESVPKRYASSDDTFNAAPYIYTSHRLAQLYPQSAESSIILNFCTVWPKQSWRHCGGVNNRESGYSCSRGFLLMLGLFLYIPPLMQDSLVHLFSTILTAIVLYAHVYLYNMHPALVAAPLYVIAVVSLLYYIYLRREQKKHLLRTVIQVEQTKIDLEAGQSGTDTDAEKPTPRVKKRVSIFLPSPEISRIRDLNPQCSDVLSLMSSNIVNYERYIVQDVVHNMITEVHERGMHYVVNDRTEYFKVMDTITNTFEEVKDSPVVETLNTIDTTLNSIVYPEAEALSNLNMVLDVLDSTKEGSLYNLSRNSIDHAHTYTQTSNFDINTALSFDVTTQSKGQKGTGKRSGGIEEEEVLYPARHLEDDDQTLHSDGKNPSRTGQPSHTSSKAESVCEPEQSYELASIVLEDSVSKNQRSVQWEDEITSAQEQKNEEKSVPLKPRTDQDLMRCEDESPLDLLKRAVDLKEQQRMILLLGAQVRREQMEHTYTTSQAQREKYIQDLIGQEDQIAKAHLETQQRRAMDHQRSKKDAKEQRDAQERYDAAMYEVGVKKSTLLKERDEAASIRAAELKRLVTAQELDFDPQKSEEAVIMLRKNVMLMGANAQRQQLKDMHTAAQAQREKDILNLIAHKEHEMQSHMEAQNERAMAQLRLLGKPEHAVEAREQAARQREAQECHDTAIQEITTRVAALEKELDEAPRLHAAELQRLDAAESFDFDPHRSKEIVIELKKAVISAGLKAQREQLEHTHVVSQAQREKNILDIVTQEEQLTQQHMEAQQQRGMAQLRTLGKPEHTVEARELAARQRDAQECHDVAMREFASKKAALEKERDEAAGAHAAELQRLVDPDEFDFESLSQEQQEEIILFGVRARRDRIECIHTPAYTQLEQDIINLTVQEEQQTQAHTEAQNQHSMEQLRLLGKAEHAVEAREQGARQREIQARHDAAMQEFTSRKAALEKERDVVASLLTAELQRLETAQEHGFDPQKTKEAVREQQMRVMPVGAKIIQDQLEQSYTVAQDQREEKITELTMVEEQLTQAHVEAQQQRAMDQLRTGEQVAQERGTTEHNDFALNEARAKKTMLEKEHKEAPGLHAEELQRLGVVTELDFDPEKIEGSLKELQKTVMVVGANTMRELLNEAHTAAQAKIEKDITDLSADEVQHTHAHMEAQNEIAMAQLRMLGKTENATDAREQAARQREAQKHHDAAIQAIISKKAALQKDLDVVAGVHFNERAELRTLTNAVLAAAQERFTRGQHNVKTGLKKAAIGMVEGVLHDKYASDEEDGDKFEIRTPMPTLSRKGRSPNARKQSERSDQLLLDAEKIVQMSQSKKKKDMNSNSDVEENADVNILPVFSAWCDDVLQELNSPDPDHVDRTRKLSRATNEGRKFSRSPIVQREAGNGYATSTPSPSKRQKEELPDYSKAYEVLQNPKYVTDIDALHRFLDALGVSEAEDLAHLDEDDFKMVFSHLKKISLKKFHNFLCRDIDPSLWGPKQHS